MNILLFNGGTSKKNTYLVVDRFEKLCKERGHKVTTLNGYFTDCLNCQYCSNNDEGVCCIQDKITEALRDKIDVVVIGTPIYFFYMSAKAKSFLDRLYCLDKTNLIFSTLCISGSPIEESGVDLIEESILRACEYCGSHYAGTFNKVTNDQYTGSLTEEDERGINELIDEIEVIFNEIKEIRE